MSANLKTPRFKQNLSGRHRDTDRVHHIRKFGFFAVLIVTTIVASLLLAGTLNNWTVSGGTYIALQPNRASVQIAVQVISLILGNLQVGVVCCLINYATLLQLNKSPQRLDVVLAWNNLITRSSSWGLRSHYLVPIVLFVFTAQVPAALWAGAITPVPVITQASSPASIPAPQYQNSSYIREYPSEVDTEGPLLRSTKRCFWV